jgi:hypothetical protein
MDVDHEQDGTAGMAPSAGEMAGGMVAAALQLAGDGLEVLPLAVRRKVPLIAGGRGLLDATTDRAKIIEWWGACPHANIGVRVPKGGCVIDIDPRHGGDTALAALEQLHGRLNHVGAEGFSGRGDGGVHLWFLAPDGPLTKRALPKGIDLITRSGYVVAPPSIHPDSGLPYRWLSRNPPTEMPAWLAKLVTAGPVARTAPLGPARSVRRQSSARPGSSKSSVAEGFCEHITWAEVLVPHGWLLVTGDGDADGSQWAHPSATSPWSATVRHGCLFVYSPNTPFDVTEAGAPRGYTRFRAYAILNHGGDLSAAAGAVSLRYTWR